jgi:hypothetical protein
MHLYYITFDSFLIELCYTEVTMKVNERTYQSYLLRMWRTGSYGDEEWRFLLENPHTGERHGFGDLDALCVFLRRQIDVIADRKTETDSVGK